MSELFSDEALHAAERQGRDSRFRWLALSDDPEAEALRAGLQHCFTLAEVRGPVVDGAGPPGSAELLRLALMHERWGQHAGALAHLLALGLLARQGFRVSSEPALDGQAPDMLATRAAARDTGRELRLLVEVRAITGAGRFPWEARRAPGRASPAEREAEARAAVTRADVLRDTVGQVLAKKARAYAALVARRELPFVICLYEDKDDQIAEVVRAVAFGRGGDPRGGAFAGPFGGLEEGLRDVSAVIVFGRVDTASGALLLRGSVLHNPAAHRPLPDAACGPGSGEPSFPLLRRLCPRGGPPAGSPRMEWEGAGPGAFTLA